MKILASQKFSLSINFVKESDINFIFSVNFNFGSNLGDNFTKINTEILAETCSQRHHNDLLYQVSIVSLPPSLYTKQNFEKHEKRYPNCENKELVLLLLHEKAYRLLEENLGYKKANIGRRYKTVGSYTSAASWKCYCVYK